MLAVWYYHFKPAFFHVSNSVFDETIESRVTKSSYLKLITLMEVKELN